MCGAKVCEMRSGFLEMKAAGSSVLFVCAYEIGAKMQTDVRHCEDLEPHFYNYHNSSHYSSAVFFLKRVVSETGFYLRSQERPTQFGPICRAILRPRRYKNSLSCCDSNFHLSVVQLIASRCSDCPTADLEKML
jgi:hypothetical protein